MIKNQKDFKETVDKLVDKYESLKINSFQNKPDESHNYALILAISDRDSENPEINSVLKDIVDSGFNPVMVEGWGKEYELKETHFTFLEGLPDKGARLLYDDITGDAMALRAAEKHISRFEESLENLLKEDPSNQEEAVAFAEEIGDLQGVIKDMCKLRARDGFTPMMRGQCNEGETPVQVVSKQLLPYLMDYLASEDISFYALEYNP